MHDLVLNIKRRACTFCTKIYYSINNFVHHSEKQPFQEVGENYIFVNVFVENDMTNWPIIFYGAFYILWKVMIDHNIKP